MSSTQTDNSKLTQPIHAIKSVGPARAILLEKLGLRITADILFFFPRRYEDFTSQSTIEELQVGELASVIGTVTDVDEKKSGGNRHVLGVLIQQGEEYLRGIWFNQEYLTAKFQIGQRVQFRGKVDLRGMRMQITHPKVNWINNAEEVPEEQLLPVYRLTEGVNQHQMRKMVSAVVDEFAAVVEESMPQQLQETTNVCSIEQAIRMIHAPKNQEQLEAATHRLVYQELLVLQLALAMRRHRVCTARVAPELVINGKIRARIENRLPFELTPSQQTAFEEIATDMGKPFPMNRLVHGDVGSGKTAVAMCAMMLAVANEHQAALMAPTEILAQQHFQTFSNWMRGSRVKTALITGSMTSKQRRETGESVRLGEIDLVIGTTALASAKTEFKNLGLVVIDEQHKFGVKQRASLRQSGFDPHYLVMTATPIPRTVTMTLFGDLDVSTIQRERQNNSKTESATNTYLGTNETREKWWLFFAKKLREGRQGFVVAPHVDGDDDSNIDSAERLFESLCNGPLSEFSLGILHGRQSAVEKSEVMRQFSAGELQALVATGVIEVGIDVPNATVMTIESAERFGLSQLHQLRGRVGRGIHPGFVCCFASTDNPGEIERLQAFESTDDGFELAQLDLQLRGPGNLFGTRQTGFPPLRIADLIRDEAVLQAAKNKAREIIDADPDLATPEFKRLRQLVTARYGKSLELGDVG